MPKEETLFREFVIDPSLFEIDRGFPPSFKNNTCRNLLSFFGWDKGNIICESPFDEWKDWKLAYGKELPTRIKRMSNGSPKTWVEWVINEHERKEFTKIICSEKTIEEIRERIEKRNEEANKENKPLIVWNSFRDYIIVWESLQKHDCTCFWGTHKRVSRIPQNLANTIDLLLLCGLEITLVDPYFSPDKRFVENLQEMIKASQKSDIYLIDSPVRNFFIHCKYQTFMRDRKNNTFYTDSNRKNIVFDSIKKINDKKNVNMGTVVSNLRKIFNQNTFKLPPNIKLTIVFWVDNRKEKPMHNRYVFSSDGGVMFGWGLDYDYNKKEVDDIVILSEEGHLKYKDIYTNEENIFLADKAFIAKIEISTVSTPNP